jgi:hypothetical protein
MAFYPTLPYSVLYEIKGRLFCDVGINLWMMKFNYTLITHSM